MINRLRLFMHVSRQSNIKVKQRLNSLSIWLVYFELKLLGHIWRRYTVPHERICVACLPLFTSQMSLTRSAVGIHACHLLSDLSCTAPSFAQIADKAFMAASPPQFQKILSVIFCTLLSNTCPTQPDHMFRLYSNTFVKLYKFLCFSLRLFCNVAYSEQN